MAEGAGDSLTSSSAGAGRSRPSRGRSRTFWPRRATRSSSRITTSRSARASSRRCTKRSRTRATSSSCSPATTKRHLTPARSSRASRRSGYHGGQDRHIVVLRCEDVPLRGLLADNVYQDFVGVSDPEERRRRIIAAAERHSSAQRPQRRRGRTFVGVPPRIAGFTGRADALDRLDAILTRDKPAAVTQVEPGGRARHGRGRKDLACRRICPPLPQPL